MISIERSSLVGVERVDHGTDDLHDVRIVAHVDELAKGLKSGSGFTGVGLVILIMRRSKSPSKRGLGVDADDVVRERVVVQLNLHGVFIITVYRKLTLIRAE